VSRQNDSSHVKQLVSIDLLVVPTIDFKLLFVFLILAHERGNRDSFQRDSTSHRRPGGTTAPAGLPLEYCARWRLVPGAPVPELMINIFD
jgi:hypothetical protein